VALIRHYLDDSELNSQDLRSLIAVAQTVKRQPERVKGLLQGMAVGLYFEKPSLRTRVSSETACTLLGAHPVLLRPEELHLQRGESIEDSAAVLGGYLDLIVARVLSHTTLRQLASANSVSIVNGLSDHSHPLQGLADMLTIVDAFNNNINGLKISYIGDFNNVARSLSWMCALLGISVSFGCPMECACDQAFLDTLSHLAHNSTATFSVHHDPVEAVKNAHVLYTDVWVSMGEEDNLGEKKRVLAPYQISLPLVKAAEKNAIVLHCLPAHFGEEITREVYNGPHSRILSQAHNRLPATAAVFLSLLAYEEFLNLCSPPFVK
jgi:ornithine carbamoyltransferase